MSTKILVIVGVSVLSVVALAVAGWFLDKGAQAPAAKDGTRAE